jgi:hypothetical protein
VDFDLVQLGGVDAPFAWRAEAADGGGAGVIDADGVWRAPNRRADVTIIAEEVPEGQSTRQRVTVADDCVGWRATVVGRAALSGEQVLVAPSGVEDGDGVNRWIFGLVSPAGSAGTVAVANHPGLQMACDGPTGAFLGQVAFNGNGWAFVAEEASVRVEALGPSMVRISFSGGGLVFDGANEEGTPTQVTGAAWSAHVCAGDDDPDPLANAMPLGAITDDPSICLEGFAADGFPAGRWDLICGATPMCVAGGRCPAANRLGRCDLRGQGNVLGFPQVQHYYPAADPVPVAELQQACGFQNGVWVPD